MPNSMTDVEFVKALKSNMHSTFESPQGQEVMKFLEATCCWYQSIWNASHPDYALMNDGKRQVLSTIKTIMALSPEQIVSLAKGKEDAI
jgi:hypothetical protein